MEFFKKVFFWLQSWTIEPLAQHNYHAAGAHYQRKLSYLDSRSSKLPILIYQMGKVGSTTVEQSLKQADINRRVYHIHYLTPEWLKTYDQKREQSYQLANKKQAKDVWTAQYVAKLVKKPLRDGEKWQVITLVRDPVARNLSSFFQHITMERLNSENMYILKSDEYDFEVTIVDNNLDQLIALFFERNRHNSPLAFFDRELKGVLNVDVFSSDFPIEQGYKIYKTDRVDVLLIRLENLNDCGPAALEEFLNIEKIALVKMNVGLEKNYSDAYQQFKNSIILSEAYLDKMYNSKYSHHFYNQAEIEQFREKWSR